METDVGTALVARSAPRARVASWGERAARAREALVRAERLTGARSVRAVPAAPSSGPSLSPLLAPSSPAPLGGHDEPARRALITTERPPMPVPPALAPLLPDGLRRGGTTAVEGSTSLVLALLAHACAGGAWAAVVGRGDLGVLAAAQAGVDLDRLALVPTPGPDAPTVVGALLDGLDVVVVGPGARMTDADRRRLSARARDRGAVLLPTFAWPGAGVTLTVEGAWWTGAGEGDGWLRAHRLRVARRGRGVGAEPAVDLVLPLGAAPGWAVVEEPAPVPAGAEPAGAEPAGAELRLVG